MQGNILHNQPTDQPLSPLLSTPQPLSPQRPPPQVSPSIPREKNADGQVPFYCWGLGSRTKSSPGFTAGLTSLADQWHQLPALQHPHVQQQVSRAQLNEPASGGRKEKGSEGRGVEGSKRNQRRVGVGHAGAEQLRATPATAQPALLSFGCKRTHCLHTRRCSRAFCSTQSCRRKAGVREGRALRFTAELHHASCAPYRCPLTSRPAAAGGPVSAPCWRAARTPRSTAGCSLQTATASSRKVGRMPKLSHPQQRNLGWGCVPQLKVKSAYPPTWTCRSSVSSCCSTAGSTSRMRGWKKEEYMRKMVSLVSGRPCLGWAWGGGGGGGGGRHWVWGLEKEVRCRAADTRLAAEPAGEGMPTGAA